MNHATLQQVRNPGSSTPTNTMTSPIPHLLDVDPFSPFEFSFPKEELWWDDSESSSMSSDEDYSAAMDLDLDFSFNTTVSDSDPISMPPSPQFCFISPEYPSPSSSTTDSSPKNDFITKIISSIRKIAPRNVYRRRKFAVRRRRQRRKRNLCQISAIEPELRTIFNSVGDLFAPSAVSKPPPSPNLHLPTINLSQVNKQMLRRLPDVVYLPVHSCSPDPGFYEKNVPIGVHDSFTSKFWKENPFGKLPAIWTNLGPVSPPTDACYGYVWTEDGWRVKAECARVPDPGGHGRGGRDREEDGRRRQIRRK